MFRYLGKYATQSIPFTLAGNSMFVSQFSRFIHFDAPLEKMVLMLYADSEGPVQTADLRSICLLIRSTTFNDFCMMLFI